MNTLSDIWSMSRSQLSKCMNDHLCDESMMPLAPLTGIYLGVSLGLPIWVKSLTWSIFVKVIITHPKNGSLIGWNMRIDQTPRLVQGYRDVPISYRMKRKQPWAFGPFFIEREERSMCLNYRHINDTHSPTRYSPLRSLRDPIISLSSAHQETLPTRSTHQEVAIGESPMILLGRSDIECFGRRYATPSWFTLEHQGAVPPQVIEAGLKFWSDESF